MASYPGRVSVSYRIRIGLVLAASGVLLSACGGSSKSTSAGAAATASASTPASPIAAATSKAATSSGSGAVSSNLGGGSFCAKTKQATANVSSASVDLISDPPAKIKTFEDTALAELKTLQSQAPNQLKGAISTVVSAEATLLDDLKASNYDFTKAATQITAQFTSPQFLAATKQIDSYLQTECGIKPAGS